MPQNRLLLRRQPPGAPLTVGEPNDEQQQARGVNRILIGVPAPDDWLDYAGDSELMGKNVTRLG